MSFLSFDPSFSLLSPNLNLSQSLSLFFSPSVKTLHKKKKKTPHRHGRVVSVGDDREQSPLHPVLPRLLQGQLHLERRPALQLRQRRVLGGHLEGEALHQGLLRLRDEDERGLLRGGDLLLVPGLEDGLEVLQGLVEPVKGGVSRGLLAGSEGGGDLSPLAGERARRPLEGARDGPQGLGPGDAQLLRDALERRLDRPHRLVVDREGVPQQGAGVLDRVPRGEHGLGLREQGRGREGGGAREGGGDDGGSEEGGGGAAEEGVSSSGLCESFELFLVFFVIVSFVRERRRPWFVSEQVCSSNREKEKKEFSLMFCLV